MFAVAWKPVAPHAKQRECAVAAVVVEFHVALQANAASTSKLQPGDAFPAQ